MESGEPVRYAVAGTWNVPNLKVETLEINTPSDDLWDQTGLELKKVTMVSFNNKTLWH